jgi:hypothetical protein
MFFFARCSITSEFSLLSWALLVLSLPGLAQRPILPVSHPTGPTMHVPAPPMYHPPIFPPPVRRPPVISTPIYAPVRTPTISPLGVLGTPPVHPPFRPIRPTRPIVLIYTLPFAFGDPVWRFNFCWWTICDLFWASTYAYTSVPSPSPMNYVSSAYETPVYVYGYEREDTPQLYLKDGSILNVTDYWLIDKQIHFTVIEKAGTRPVERSMPFDALDLQKTVDVNTARGFRFVLRNEPFEQYVRDHSEAPPPDVAFPPE